MVKVTIKEDQGIGISRGIIQTRVNIHPSTKLSLIILSLGVMALNLAKAEG